MTPYPAIVPMDSVQVLSHAAFNYKDAKKKDVAAAAWDLAGFVLGQTIGGVDKFGDLPEISFNGLVGARDPKKEATVQKQVLGFLSLVYGMSLFNKDPGIPAVLLALNGLVVQNWPSLADTYWSAKGM
jgi:hypothetical protein